MKEKVEQTTEQNTSSPRKEPQSFRQKAGEFFFKNRGYTPVPFVVIVVFLSQPTWRTFWIGLSLMVLGEGIRIWAMSYMEGTTRSRRIQANQLITSGPYRFIRNPLYLGNLLLYAGVAIMTNIWVPYFLVLSLLYFIIQYILIIEAEEKVLHELFGAAFEQYCATIPRFFPNFKSYPQNKDIEPRISKAFKSEKSSLLSFSLILLYFVIRLVYSI
ncbi:MAG: isoprenylcysteine carboxylmethyltransferase family protein [Calditrichaeota bacterium]|nr:MAG: isoprenylcysteine carboxylmethyltransferase family protein [Calditrichota bacterium]